VTPLSRWHRDASLIRSALGDAAAATDFPPTLFLIAHYRGKLDDTRPLSDVGASSALARFGPNGLGPAIEDVIKQARFHGRAQAQRRAA
jgi:hypothetical protein